MSRSQPGRTTGSQRSTARHKSSHSAGPLTQLSAALRRYSLLAVRATTGSASPSTAVKTPPPIRRPLHVAREKGRSQAVTAGNARPVHAAVPAASSQRAPSVAHIPPCILRPHVKAAERFHRWHSQYGIARDMENAATLPARARRARFDTIMQSVEPSTRETYSAGLLRFHEFCDAQHVAEDKRMPASDFLLSAFVAHHAGRVGKSCIDNWLAGLQFWHNLHDAAWLGNRALAASAKGVRKLAPASSSRPRRAPVTVEHMRCLRERLDLSDPFDAAVYGAAVVAFRGCCRLGELVVQSATRFDRTRHVPRDTVIECSTSASGLQVRKMRLPWSKTTGAAGADIVLSASRDAVCPVSALDNHLAVNAGAPPDSPLFAWKDKYGAWCPLTRGWLLKRCSSVWAGCGLATVQGHSFRIGGATDLLLRGVQPAVVAVQGRWRSRAFLQYWRNVEAVIPDFIDRAAPSVTVESIAAAVARMESDIA